MKTYNIEITEVLQRTIAVEAKTEAEAERQVRELYRMSEIVLSSDDYMQTDFEAIDIEAQ